MQSPKDSNYSIKIGKHPEIKYVIPLVLIVLKLLNGYIAFSKLHDFRDGWVKKILL